MTDILKSVVLGIVEGLTEFLPVSSTGHMILAEPLLGVNGEEPVWKTFLYFIQIGAILAVIIYFWKPLTEALLKPTVVGDADLADAPRDAHFHLAIKLAVAFFPAGVVGLVAHKWLEAHLEKPVPVALALILGAGVMEWIERGHRGGAIHDVRRITLRQALFVGLAQCVSMVPGTSRSMATIMGGLLVGLAPETAAVFSFYLAIPTLIAAGGYSMFKHRHDIHGDSATMLAVGFITAFVVALVVVEAFMKFVRTRPLRPFAAYRVVLGGLVLACFAAGWLT